MSASNLQIRGEFWAFLALARKGWRIDRRHPFFLTASLIGMLQWVLPIVLATIALAGPDNAGLDNFSRLAGTDAYLAYSVIGATTFLWTSWLTAELANNLRFDRSLGTLPTIWATTTTRFVLIVGGAIGRTFTPSVMAVGTFSLAWALFRFPLEPSVGPALALLVCSGMATIAVALPWAAILLRYREGYLVVQLFVMGAGILAGIAYPVAVLPGWAQWLSALLPPTWMIRGLRSALIFSDLRDVVLACAVLLAMALVYGAAGLVLLHIMDRAARAKGELEWM
ncbi:MAG: ABC transporter permease [Chloroflexi bacterium]|nr:ABC transporter permease [Chloroflexota bacterium]MCY3958959.1 ABC transporter permease [Chloroflexota bacterium]